MANIKSESTEQLVQENQRLKQLLDSLIEKANSNEATLVKFQTLEFELLSCADLPSLLDKLTLSFKSSLNLAEVSLVLFDPIHAMQDLLQQIYPDYHTVKVSFVDNNFELEENYPDRQSTLLRKKNYLVSRQLFGKTTKVESFAQLPLYRRGTLIGSYHLGSLDPDRFSPEMSTDFFEHFGQIIAVCIENTVNSDRLKQMTLMDPLTKTKNRRSLIQSLKKEVARAERDLKPLSCLFIDLDHFKKINDQYGHPIGDKALITVAEAIKPHLRTTDVLARFGGEEFALLLPNCESSVAINIAERIRNVLKKQTLVAHNHKAFKLTCSIGVTTWDPLKFIRSKSQIGEKLIRVSDMAVYKAKSKGRDCCEFIDLEEDPVK